jgi:predicted ribosome quality control (RQC) complex YloA/Tae2 family protein
MIMEIEIDFTKSAQENANEYYKKSKKLLVKRQGAEKAVKDLEDKLSDARENAVKKPEKRMIKTVKKEWYENFHWFYTSNNMLAIGGRDAHQNEIMNSKHFEEKDLFFHADIFGAPVFILKDGESADKEIRAEVAEFAASYSKAWQLGQNTVDVYAMRRDQVSKSSSKGSLGTGSFLLSGERDWYRNVKLSLVMFVKEERLYTVPEITFRKLEGAIVHAKISKGNFKKSDAAKKISTKLNYHDLDTIMRQLPVGSFRIE